MIWISLCVIKLYLLVILDYVEILFV